MTEDVDLARIVEFKLYLVKAVEDHLLRELQASAKEQGRKVPYVTRTLLRTGATTAVSELSPSDLSQFTLGESWQESLRSAVESGAWNRLVEDTLRHSFAPEVS